MIDPLIVASIPVLLLLAWIGWKTAKLDRGGSLPETGWANRLAWKWHRSNALRREKLRSLSDGGTRLVPDRTPDQVDEARRVARRARIAAEEREQRAAKDVPVQRTVDVADTVDGRLLEQFRAFRAGAITLDDYHAAIVVERDGVRAEMKNLRANRKYMTVDEYEDEILRLEEELDDTTWRLDWVKEQDIAGSSGQ